MCWGVPAGVVYLSTLSCAAHQILTNFILCTITHRFMAGSSKVIGQRKKRRKLELEPGSENLQNNWQALASLVGAAVRDPRRLANQEALKDGPGPSWSWNWDTSKRLDCLASLARDPRVAVRGVRDRQVDQEALKDRDGLRQSQNPPVSLARDPRAAKA